MLPVEAFFSDKEKVTDKVYGALIGLAIGDSMGDAARKQQNRENYGITLDLDKGSSWSTDDTEFALLTAKTLIRCKGHLTTEECVRSWMEDVVTQDEFKRGGASEIEAAHNLRRGIRPPESGKFNTFHMSDGSSMRIGPIGIICAGEPEKAKALAKIEAELSHYRDGVWGAQAVAAAVSVAMVDADMDEILNVTMEAIPAESWLYHNMTEAFALLDQKGNIWDAWMELHDLLRTSTWATTAEAIPAAFSCLKMVHKDFVSGMKVAANFGRDADTIGAVVGVILGAKYGAGSIPEHWKEKTRYPSGTCLQFTKGIDIKEYADQMVQIMLEH